MFDFEHRTIQEQRALTCHYHTRPFSWGPADHFCESPLGTSISVMSVHKAIMHCMTSQYVIKPRDVMALCVVKISAKAPPVAPSPCRVPLYIMFQPESPTHRADHRVGTYVTKIYQFHLIRAISIYVIRWMLLMKAKTSRRVRAI